METIFDYVKQEEKLFAKKFWKEHKAAYASGDFMTKKKINMRFHQQLEQLKDNVCANIAKVL